MSLLQKLDEIRARCAEHESLFQDPPLFSPVDTFTKYKEFVRHARTDLPELEQALREAYILIKNAKRLGWIKKEDFCWDEMVYWLEKYDGLDTE